jgi:hypothetical protein
VSVFAAFEHMEKDGLPPSQLCSLPQETKENFILCGSASTWRILPHQARKIKARKKDCYRNFSSQQLGLNVVEKDSGTSQLYKRNTDDFRSPCSDQESSDIQASITTSSEKVMRDINSSPGAPGQS